LQDADGPGTAAAPSVALLGLGAYGSDSDSEGETAQQAGFTAVEVDAQEEKDVELPMLNPLEEQSSALVMLDKLGAPPLAAFLAAPLAAPSASTHC
jgi:hypothetical protein